MKQTQLPFLLSSMAAFAMVGGGLSPLALAAQNSDKLQLVQTGPGNLAKTKIYGARKINDHAVELLNERGQKITIDFYGPNIFRYFQDSVSNAVRKPAAKPEADILVEQPRKAAGEVQLVTSDRYYTLATAAVEVKIDRVAETLAVTDLRSNREVLHTTAAPTFQQEGVGLTLACEDNEFFYGGGVQNGRFSHRGQRIAIENTNNWVDGGVASPTPFYWWTAGYGVMWHTALLNDFYQLTGHPVLLPKFGFYEGHLNAYNRDYWTEAKDGKGFMKFEDGKTYNESQKNNGGIRESLNGELNNYQFSARAAIDRYIKHDMPLGWFLPNDGYGAGYGQTATLDGNIANLKSFGDYARSKGVEIGLWTQSDLHPKDSIEALLQRDIVKEVKDAGVRVLKTDVAWVGWGYSFGLNGVADVGKIMPFYGNNARPFIISLDGWAAALRRHLERRPDGR